MRRINNPPSNLFIDGNASTGTLGTRVMAAWLNAIQEELAYLVETVGGVALDPEKNTQVAQVIAALITNALSSEATARSNADAAEAAARANVYNVLLNNDNVHAGQTDVHGASYGCTGNRITKWDPNGRLQCIAGSEWMHAVNVGQFGGAKALSGIMRLPNGWKIQTQRVEAGSFECARDFGNVYYPEPFTGGVISITPSVDARDSAALFDNFVGINWEGTTNSYCRLYSGITGDTGSVVRNYGVRIVAIGFDN